MGDCWVAIGGRVLDDDNGWSLVMYGSYNISRGDTRHS